MDLKLTTRTRDDGTAVVSAVGDIDCYTSARLRQALRDVTGRYLIILDLSGCEFLDQYGLGVIVGALKRCRQHDGSLAIAGASGNVAKVFRITGLTKVFGIYATADEAAEALLGGAR